MDLPEHTLHNLGHWIFISSFWQSVTLFKWLHRDDLSLHTLDDVDVGDRMSPCGAACDNVRHRKSNPWLFIILDEQCFVLE